ncbi:MAG: VanZ family protein [Ferruginibacter sp.]
MIVHFFKPLLLICLFVLPLWIIVRTVIAAINNKNTGSLVNAKKELLLVFFIIYITSVLSLTLAPASLTHFNNPHQLRLNYIPFVNIYNDLCYMFKISYYEVTEIVLENLLGNILLFIPMGFFIPLLFPTYGSIKKILIICVLFSFLIELTQFLMYWYGTNRTADIDDIILNTLGGFLGFVIYRKFFKNLQAKFELYKNIKN